MKDRKWKKLIRDLHEGRCILMLGSGLSGIKKEGQWQSLSTAFSEYLATQLDEEGIKYEKGQEKNLPYISQLFMTIEDVRRIDLEDEAKDFIKSNTTEIPPIYHQLAQLPISLVINTSFDDNNIEKAFNRTGKSCHSHFYNFKRKSLERINSEKISINSPLIYNLFGAIDKTESMVLTDEDQLEFVHNVVRENPGIPEQVLEQFDHSKTYLFFGFNLEHWQFRLLLESLNLKEGNQTHAPNGLQPLSGITKKIFETRFKFHFIDRGMVEFLAELTQRYGDFAAVNKIEEKRPHKKIFLAYAEEDKSIVEEIEIFTNPLIERNELTIWHKEKIPFGKEEDVAIRTLMEQSDAILLLLSADFLSDDTLKNREIAWAFEIQQEKNIPIIPVIGRNCAWEIDDRLRKLAALPSNKQPIVDGSGKGSDQAYFDFFKQLKKRIW